MRYAIADCRISEECKSTLSRFVDKIILLPPHGALPSPVASHPDMLIWVYGKNIITYRDYCKTAAAQLDILANAGFELIFTDERVSAEYPCDVALNCALVGKHIICREASTSKKIKQLAEREGLALVNTRQGYAKCSCATVSENAIITADRSILKAARAVGIDALLISEGNVSLKGYNSGFIGGACGSTHDFIFFCGALDSHPDEAAIRSFCQRHGKRTVSLSCEPLVDLGTVFVIES